MKRKFQELGETLDEFVSQPEYPMLVVECGSDDIAYVTLSLQALEQTHPEAWVLIFPAPFPSAAAYLDSILEQLHHQIEAAAPFRQERGEPPFPPVPAELADRARTPAERLRGVLDYLRSLLPNPQEQVLALGLLPAQCGDFGAYAELVASVMPIGDIEPWMLPLRLVVYDDRGQPVLRPLLDRAECDTVLTYSVDFSVPALNDELVRSAADTSLPPAERMASLLELAMMDHTNQRYVQALEKFGALHNYYEEQQMPVLQAMCLYGAGEAVSAGGQPKAAKRLLQRGLALAAEHKALPVFLNLLVSIVGVCLRLGDYEEAESYAESGMMVSAVMLDPHSYANLDEKKGDAQLGQGKVARALSTYLHCAEASRNNAYYHRCKSALTKRARIYEEANMTEQRRQVEAELRRMEELERTGEAPFEAFATGGEDAHAPPSGARGVARAQSPGGDTIASKPSRVATAQLLASGDTP